ncbi:hypothetical protein RM697_00360 [Ichthyenterobacterium sp. W332]|uniref:Uncharacterized protein n=1 Tax=Microcosmobacter mediterraneus TaxID=3075607 RepID=A0ABU2YFX2_9FLAO|nr:hypothetical protein [Ichthyenterobacterium sp. W332]MDT0557075.1 hypothetical protein [Ichthyenterobacterium sp. W332]
MKKIISLSIFLLLVLNASAQTIVYVESHTTTKDNLAAKMEPLIKQGNPDYWFLATLADGLMVRGHFALRR